MQYHPWELICKSPSGVDRTAFKLRLFHSPAVVDFHRVQYLVERNRNFGIGDDGGIA